MIIVHSADHRLRNPQTELSGGQLVRPFECPERIDLILARAAERGFDNIQNPRSFDSSALLSVHEPDYLDFLQTCWQEWKARGNEGEAIANVFPSRRMWRQKVPSDIEGKIGWYCLANETAICAGTWQGAKAAAACAMTAAELVNEGAGAAFSLSRPPGHHAAQDMFGGYCFLNNAALAAQRLRDLGAERVAILDVDFHHGNGTQTIFYDRADVMVVNLHGDPDQAFPHFLGDSDELGSGAGEGFNHNFPMPDGTGFAVWRQALAEACKKIEAYAPDALVVSLGVDTYEHDPISFFKLTSADFKAYGADLASLKLPTVFVLEGGYAVEAIGINTINVLEGCVGA